MKIIKLIILTSFVFSFTTSFAAKLKGVEHLDTIDFSGEKLVLNGMALRSVRSMRTAGIAFKVYVAGLYLTEKNNEFSKILSSKSTKRIEMSFLRTVPKKDYRGGWVDSFKDECLRECQVKHKEAFKQFKKFLPTLKKKDIISFTFQPDGLLMTLKKKSGEESTLGKVSNPAFANMILEMFLQSKKNKKFSKALLGN